MGLGTSGSPWAPGGGGDQPCPPEVQHWKTHTVPAAAGSQCRPFVDDADPGETLGCWFRTLDVLVGKHPESLPALAPGAL